MRDERRDGRFVRHSKCRPGADRIGSRRLRLGIALKARDGAGRAAEAAVLRLIESLLELEETQVNALKGIRSPVLTNWNGIEVGRVS